MYCEVYQGTVRSLRHRNICEEFTGLRLYVLLTSLLKVCFPCGRFCCERLALSKVERCIFVSGPRHQPSWQPCVRISSERYRRWGLTIHQQQSRRWRRCILLYWSFCVDKSLEVCLRCRNLWKIQCLWCWTRSSKEINVYDTPRLPRNRWHFQCDSTSSKMLSDRLLILI